jgi:acyl-CoA dehydrogenase
MRAVGQAEKALELLCKRGMSRSAFGKPLVKLGANYDIIAKARMDIEMARLLCLKTAWMMDNVGVQESQHWISMIKTVAPNVALSVVDEAIQMHGGLGISQDTPLAGMYMALRTLRFADGPDAVHRMVVARSELKKYR